MSQVNSHNESSELLVRDAQGQYRLATGDEVLQAARQVIGRRVRRGSSMSSPQTVRDYLRTKLAEREHEVFVTLLLDLCALVKNVELAGQARAAEDCPAPALHINLVKAVATSVRLPACRALPGPRVAEPARREILGQGLGA